MHFGEISTVAGRVNKKAGSYIHDVYIAAAWMLQQGIRGDRTTSGNSTLPSKHFLFSKTSSRRLQDVFSVTLFVFQDVFLKCLQDVFKTSPRRLARRLQDVFKTCLQDVLQLCLQDVLEDKKNVTLKTTSRRIQDVFSTSSPRRMFLGEISP